MFEIGGKGMQNPSHFCPRDGGDWPLAGFLSVRLLRAPGICNLDAMAYPSLFDLLVLEYAPRTVHSGHIAM